MLCFNVFGLVFFRYMPFALAALTISWQCHILSGLLGDARCWGEVYS